MRLSLFLCGVSNCDWSRTNAVSHGSLADRVMNVSAVPVHAHPTHTLSVCIPSISLPLMDKHVWRWQQDTGLKETWWEIFPVICGVNLSVANFTFVTTARFLLGYFIWFWTFRGMHEYDSQMGPVVCADSRRSNNKTRLPRPCAELGERLQFCPWGKTRTALELKWGAFGPMSRALYGYLVWHDMKHTHIKIRVDGCLEHNCGIPWCTLVQETRLWLKQLDTIKEYLSNLMFCLWSYENPQDGKWINLAEP